MNKRWPDDAWAEHVSSKHGAEPNKTIAELRTKLEIRTWFLRASLAINTGVAAAIIIRLWS